MKPHQIHVLAFPVLRNFEQIHQAQESRLTRQRRGDIGETDRLIESTSISPSSMR